MSDKVQLTVKMEVTVAQALALEAMFEYWNNLGSMGSSRNVAFFVDGDGNFQPNCKVSFEGEVPKLTDELREKAISEEVDGDRIYDFDVIAWSLTEDD